jgi:hypothetical protein
MLRNQDMSQNSSGIEHDSATLIQHLLRTAMPATHDSNQWPSEVSQITASESLLQHQNDWTLPSSYSINDSWLLGDDFDVSALDTSVTAAIASWGQTLPMESVLPPEQSHSDTLMQQVEAENGSPIPFKTAALVQTRWYTNITPSASVSHGLVSRAEQERIDERYRSSLSSHLRTQITDDALPSADFLVRYTFIRIATCSRL